VGFFIIGVFINMITDVDYIMSLLDKFTTVNSGEVGEQEGESTGSAPYPTVTKWSSGRNFGPTYNPEQKVWTTGLTRGKANTLL